MENPQAINEHLKQYGYDLNGLQRFRVVFSDHEKEIDGVTPKYSYIIERWVLERYFPEFQEYIAIWTFSIDGNYVFPQIEWCDQLCYISMATPEEKKRDLKQMEADEIARFVKNAETLLNEDSGVHDMKGQTTAFVRPVFLNLDFEINKGKK